MSVVVVIAQTFLAIYALFRNMNYYDMNAPFLENFFNAVKGAALASDAFFPFDDNIQRAHASGVDYVAQPGGSIRDDAVIACCDRSDMFMAFTGMRLFHH